MEQFYKTAGLARLLEKYKLPNNDHDLVKISDEDRPQWDAYFREVISAGVLDDPHVSFGEGVEPPLKVQSEGAFTRVACYRLLMQCYRVLFAALSSGKLKLKTSCYHIAGGNGLLEQMILAKAATL